MSEKQKDLDIKLRDDENHTDDFENGEYAIEKKIMDFGDKQSLGWFLMFLNCKWLCKIERTFHFQDQM